MSEIRWWNGEKNVDLDDAEDDVTVTPKGRIIISRECMAAWHIGAWPAVMLGMSGSREVCMARAGRFEPGGHRLWKWRGRGYINARRFLEANGPCPGTTITSGVSNGGDGALSEALLEFEL